MFSALVTGAVLIDPMQPTLNPWRALGGHVPSADPDLLGVAAAHLVYSLVVYLALSSRLVTAARLTAVTTWMDVLFGAVVAAVAGATTGLFYYPFFTFAVVAAGLQTGFRRTMQVTGVSVALWIGAIAVSAPADIHPYVMRPIGLAIVGYLVGHLGQRRLELEREMRELETTRERLRIARELHDGSAQVLAAVNLQLDNCRALLRHGRVAEVLGELGELQRSVTSEYDELRAYVRSLAGLAAVSTPPTPATDPRFSVRVQVDGPGAIVEQVFRILREGVTNVRRHAQAQSAVVRAETLGAEVRIAIEDDGVGFGQTGGQPWSISSRVEELGGSLRVARDRGPGAHLHISLPAA